VSTSHSRELDNAVRRIHRDLRFLLRIIVIPAFSLFVVYNFVLPGMEYPGYLEPEIRTVVMLFTLFTVAVSQWHWMRVLNRLEALEDRLDDLDGGENR